jgi:AcrR family transcriptional regulator
MERARAAAIAGAIDVLAKRGAKALTMADVADAGGLARATLYNHVRDKQSLFHLVLGHEAREVANLFTSESTLPKALTRASQFIAEHPALVGVRANDPLSLAPLAVPTSGEGWTAIRELTRQALVARGGKGTPAQVDVLLRWLTSFIVEPSDDASRSSQASALAKSLH